MNLQLPVLKYDLPDLRILDSASDYEFFIWQPDNFYIILGRANNLEDSVFYQAALNDHIKIIKRPSGGESVMLSPKMVVFSLKQNFNHFKNPRHIFTIINKSLIVALTSIGIENLNFKGISDLSIKGKKILGSSMYLKNGTLFYHAVLNVCEDTTLISKYLKHPAREPDYRMGRDHNEFVTSIHKEGFILDIQLIIGAIKEALTNLEYELKN
ncbi:MAG: hypothetical protein ABFC28_09965 [Rikenellaceae bacterium]